MYLPSAPQVEAKPCFHSRSLCCTSQLCPQTPDTNNSHLWRRPGSICTERTPLCQVTLLPLPTSLTPWKQIIQSSLLP